MNFRSSLRVTLKGEDFASNLPLRSEIFQIHLNIFQYLMCLVKLDGMFLCPGCRSERLESCSAVDQSWRDSVGSSSWRGLDRFLAQPLVV